MISVYNLKPKFQQILVPVVRGCNKANISPNAVTLMAIFGSFGVAGAVSVFGENRYWFAAIPIWMFVRMALNAIDGYYARTYDKESVSGFMLNEIGDVVSDLVLFLPFAIFVGEVPWLVVGLGFLAFSTEFIGVLGYKNDNRRYDGPFGKSDRALFLGILAVFYIVWPDFSLYSSIYSIAIFLSLVTITKRWLNVLKG